MYVDNKEGKIWYSNSRNMMLLVYTDQTLMKGRKVVKGPL